MSAKGEGVCVCVRLRQEAPAEGACVQVQAAANRIVASENGSTGEEEFCFDHVFEGISNYSLYSILGKRVLANIFSGFNTCVFAYGQTGSGKTHTMLGSPTDAGVIPRLCQNLFAQIEILRNSAEDGSMYQADVQVEYMEIYNEKFRDLFNPSCKEHLDEKTGIRVREHPENGVYVEGLLRKRVESSEEIAELMEQGNAERTVAATAMNSVSSRSHAIFTIRFTQSTSRFDRETGKEVVTSRKSSTINLIDLAGSERVKRSGVEGKELKEAANINKSLLMLGNVIAKLADAEEGKPEHIPYRDTKLTWLLKESLGGNSKTVMIATISPLAIDGSETLSTLRYAGKCKKIVNNVVVNEDKNARLIKVLQEEISTLRAMLAERDKAAEESQASLVQLLQTANVQLAQKDQLWKAELDRALATHQQQIEESKSETNLFRRSLDILCTTEELERLQLVVQVREEVATAYTWLACGIAMCCGQASAKQRAAEVESETLRATVSQLSAQYSAAAQDLQRVRAELERKSQAQASQELTLPSLSLAPVNPASPFAEFENPDRTAEMVALKLQYEDEIEQLRRRAGLLEKLLTEPQKREFFQRFFNGEEVAVEAPNHRTSPTALPPVASTAQQDIFAGLDDLVVQHQAKLFEESRNRPVENAPTPPSLVLGTDASISRPTSSLVWDDFGFVDTGTQPATVTNSAQPTASNPLLPPHLPPRVAQSQPSPTQPAESAWDLINQKLIDMGFSEEDRAAIVCSGVDLNDEAAVFAYIMGDRPRANPPSPAVPTAQTVQTPLASPVAHIPPAAPVPLQQNLQPIPISSPTSIPMAVTVTVNSGKSARAIKKDVEGMIAAQLMAPLPDDLSYFCRTLLHYVTNSVVTVKEVLHPLKAPLEKKESIQQHLTILFILEALLSTGHPGFKAEILGKKWLERIVKVGLQSQPAGHRVRQLLMNWKAVYQHDPLGPMVIWACEKYNTGIVDRF